MVAKGYIFYDGILGGRIVVCLGVVSKRVAAYKHLNYNRLGSDLPPRYFAENQHSLGVIYSE